MNESNLLKLSINDFVCIQIEFLFYLTFEDEVSLFKNNNKINKLVSFNKNDTRSNVIIDTIIKKEFNLFKYFKNNKI